MGNVTDSTKGYYDTIIIDEVINFPSTQLNMIVDGLQVDAIIGLLPSMCKWRVVFDSFDGRIVTKKS